jgi:dTDP-4-dehydrorhamnose reductase
VGALRASSDSVTDRVLIVGGDGLIGRSLRARSAQAAKPALATVLVEQPVPGNSVHFDMMRDPWPALPDCRAAILCAAIANQEQCRRDPAGTRELNVVRTLRLARQLAARGTFVVFISSNQVFDGNRPLCQPDQPVSPRTEYGRQKAEAEAGLLQLGEQSAIVRLTKVFFSQLPILQKWHASLSAGQPITPFSNYLCSPVPLDCVTECIWQVAERALSGIWQVSTNEDVSYADIALALGRCRGLDSSLIHPADAPAGVLEHLPAFTTLDSSSVREGLEVRIPTSEETLAAVLGG